MRDYTFTTEQWVPAPLDDVFAFFADVQNLPRLSPPDLEIRIRGAELVAPAFVPPLYDGRQFAGAGSNVRIRFVPPEFSIPMEHEAHITDFVWGRMFRDRTSQWPLLRWDHKHEFAPLERNGVRGTLVRDLVRYSLGPGWLGALLHRLFVGKAVAEMFAYRQRALEKIVGAGALLGHGFTPALTA
ncbi:MAG TPA: SRPBCC family protein [Terriglobales bacterium]|nr:SRPBCC family protein [Terriglobales bacterium]